MVSTSMIFRLKIDYRLSECDVRKLSRHHTKTITAEFRRFSSEQNSTIHCYIYKWSETTDSDAIDAIEFICIFYTAAKPSIRVYSKLLRSALVAVTSSQLGQYTCTTMSAVVAVVFAMVLSKVRSAAGSSHFDRWRC